jgi:hypothetical protein
MFDVRVAKVPVHPRHWLKWVPEQVEQLESQGTHDLPLLLGVKPGLQTQLFPLTEAFGTQVRQIEESAALHVAQRPEQVRQAPLTVFKKKPVSQSHSLLAATVSLLWALGLQISHWLTEFPLQVAQVLWQPAWTQ